jgi:hypothetical protein
MLEKCIKMLQNSVNALFSTIGSSLFKWSISKTLDTVGKELASGILTW